MKERDTTSTWKHPNDVMDDRKNLFERLEKIEAEHLPEESSL